MLLSPGCAVCDGCCRCSGGGGGKGGCRGNSTGCCIPWVVSSGESLVSSLVYSLPVSLTVLCSVFLVDLVLVQSTDFDLLTGSPTGLVGGTITFTSSIPFVRFGTSNFQLMFNSCGSIEVGWFACVFM